MKRWAEMSYIFLYIRTSQILMMLNAFIFESLHTVSKCSYFVLAFFKHPNLTMAKITIKFEVNFLFVNFPLCFLTNIGLIVFIIESVVEEISSNLKNSSNLLQEFESDF